MKNKINLTEKKFFISSELEQLTGVAAILRFPMPELEDESDGDDSSEDDWQEYSVW